MIVSSLLSSFGLIGGNDTTTNSTQDHLLSQTMGIGNIDKLRSSENNDEVTVHSLFRIFLSLGIIYTILLLIPIIQLIRIHIGGFPILKLTTQKTFLLLLTLTCILRVIFFFIISFTKSNSTFDIGKFSNEIYTILDDLGCITFFTTFCLLILFWIEIVYHSRNKQILFREKVKPIFMLMILLIYVIQIVIWILIFTLPLEHRERIDKLDNTFYAAISMMATGGFLYYGYKLSVKLKRNPLNSRGKKKKLIEVIIFTLLCTICFITRSLLFLVVSYYETLHVTFSTIAIYYSITEVVPSLFVIFLFRKMPPKPAVTPIYKINSGSDEYPPYIPANTKKNKAHYSFYSNSSIKGAKSPEEVQRLIN
ncbi:hypothetical protein CYY_009950 [Polysphondylium violaceum]|uniref:THH1/TOM1/TOM3 domain-containing protein n=1 Tax=Polysphondylium violaceum TaxID=133409 RepID=A0A8J4V2G6_9MYCE|nr:hypothetical protein CYY_009950 [Polysphondylium violaceum]